MPSNIELFSSRIKFEDLLSLVDKAINTGKDIQVTKSMVSQNNTTMRFLKWLEKHKIISVVPIEIITPKRISIRSRKRKVEISLQLLALKLPMKEVAKKFNVKLATAQGYLKELAPFSDQYLHALRIALNFKKVTLDTRLEEFPSYPIRIHMNDLKEGLSQKEYEQLMKIVVQNRYIKTITGQKLGTTDLSFLLPE